MTDNNGFGVDSDADANAVISVTNVSGGNQHGTLVFNSDGSYVKKIGKRDQFDRLSSVTVDGDGKRIYVVDIGGVSSQNHRVRVFDVETGSHLFDIGKQC